MSSSKQLSKISSKINESSPLHGFWESSQTERDNYLRLSIVNKQTLHKPELDLFRQEPYKWEILYQSVLRDIVKGNQSSINSLKRLLLVLEENECKKVLLALKEKGILNTETVNLLLESARNQFQDVYETSSNIRRNPCSFLRVLIAIFTNPYGIKIKGQKKYIYEKTGSFFGGGEV